MAPQHVVSRLLLVVCLAFSAATAATIPTRIAATVQGQPVTCPAVPASPPLGPGQSVCFSTAQDGLQVQQAVSTLLDKSIVIGWRLAANGQSLGLVSNTDEGVYLVRLFLFSPARPFTLLRVESLAPSDLANSTGAFISTPPGLWIVGQSPAEYLVVENEAGFVMTDYHVLQPGRYRATISVPGQEKTFAFTVGTDPVFLPAPALTPTETPGEASLALDNPTGAVVMILDERGYALTSIAHVRPGKYRASFSAPGFLESLVELDATQTARVALTAPTLSPLPAMTTSDPYGGGFGYSSDTGGSGGSVYVRGYYRSNGTWVAPYTRSAPRR